jgi:hypothetical protein
MLLNIPYHFHPFIIFAGIKIRRIKHSADMNKPIFILLIFFVLTGCNSGNKNYIEEVNNFNNQADEIFSPVIEDYKSFNDKLEEFSKKWADSTITGKDLKWMDSAMIAMKNNIFKQIRKTGELAEPLPHYGAKDSLSLMLIDAATLIEHEYQYCFELFFKPYKETDNYNLEKLLKTIDDKTSGYQTGFNNFKNNLAAKAKNN